MPKKAPRVSFSAESVPITAERPEMPIGAEAGRPALKGEKVYPNGSVPAPENGERYLPVRRLVTDHLEDLAFVA